MNPTRLCRFCRKGSTESKLTKSINEDTIVLFLGLAPSIVLSDDRTLPGKICENCCENVKNASNFIRSIKENQKQIHLNPKATKAANEDLSKFWENSPSEVLELVLKPLDPNVRKRMVFVCRKFHKTICWLERDKKLTLNFDQIMDDVTFKSILITRRRCEELTLNLGKVTCEFDEFQRIEQIALKFGSNLKALSIEGGIFTEYELMTVLTYVPGVENLKLVSIKLSPSAFQVSELNLPRLKKLYCSCASFERLQILNCIPAGLLEEVTLIDGSHPAENYKVFIDRQPNITKLGLHYIGTVRVNHLKLKELSLSRNKVQDFSVVISQQSCLKYLDLMLTRITANDFRTICKLVDLEVLKINLDNFSSSVFRALRELERLKELELFLSDSEGGHLAEMSLMAFPKLKKLSLLEQSAPHFLRHLSPFFMQTLERSRSLESLQVNVDIFAHEIDDQVEFDSVKELVIRSNHEDCMKQQFLTFIKACRCLERILLMVPKNLTCEDVKAIVEDHPSLTHFILRFSKTESFEFNDELFHAMKNKPMLVFVQLIGLKIFPSISGGFKHLGALLQEFTPTITAPEDGMQVILRKGKVQVWNPLAMGKN